MLIFNPKTVRCSLPILLIFSSIILFAWTPPVNISNTEGGSDYAAICQDKKCWLHVVWEDDTHGDVDIYYTFYDGTVWSDTLNVSDDSTTSWCPDVAADTLNRIHVVWFDYYTMKVMWTIKDSTGWSEPISISGTVAGSHAPEVDVSPVTNYVHCVWHNLGDAEIWHSYYDGSSWSTPENVTQDSNDDAWADVAVDALGRIHLVWKDYGLNDIFYSRKDSISWSPFVNISNLTGQSCDPRIAIDNENNPRVVWEERVNNGNNEVYYTYYNGGQWVEPILVDVDYSSRPDIAVDKENYSHILWKHKSTVNDIFYAMYEDTNLVDSIVNMSNTPDYSTRPSVEIGPTGIHVVWCDGSSGYYEIYYSKDDLSGIDESLDLKNNNLSYSLLNTNKLNFSFVLSEQSSVSINIYDLTGRKIKEKFSDILSRGSHQYELSLELSSGIYFLNVKTQKDTWWGKFVVVNP